MPLTSDSFSATSWRAMKMSVPQSNSTHTTAMPTRSGRADTPDARRAVDGALDRERDERFHLLRRHAVAFGEDRHRRRRQIREHVDRHLPRRPHAGGEQQHREPDDEPVMVDRPLNDVVSWQLLNARVLRPAEPFAADASCTSYAPRVTTRSPGLTPLLQPDQIAFARGDLDEAAREAFAAVCTKTYGRPASISTAAFGTAGTRMRSRVVEQGRAGLSDQQLTAADSRPRTARQARVSSGSMTPASCTWCGLSGQRIRAPGQFERDGVDVARQGDIGGRHKRLQLDFVGPDDAEERRAFVVRGAERGGHLGDASGRSVHAATNALPAAAPPPVPRVWSRCASRACAARSCASATVTRAFCFFDASRRNSPFRQQPLRPRLLGARRLESGLALRATSAASVARSSPRALSRGSSRPKRLAGADAAPIDTSESAANRPAAGAATIASPPVSG